MAKKYIIYAGGKDLAIVPVTQNEVGVYYWNGSTYHRPVLSQFNNTTLPSGFKKYTNGSHTVYISNPLRNPIDFSLVAGTAITANFDVNVLSFTYSGGSWCKARIAGTDIDLGFVHTYQWASGLVKAGNIICRVAPKSVTGFDPHLHMDIWGSYLIRDLILTGNVKMSDQLKIGDKVQITGGDMNLRGGAGTGFTNDVRTIKEGAVVQIKDGIRTSQNSLFYGKGSTIKENDSYLWIDVRDLVGQTGWIAITNRVVKVHGNTGLTNFDGTVPSAPPPPVVVDPTIELQKRITELEKKVKELTELLGASNEQVEKDRLKIIKLESDLKLANSEIVEMREQAETDAIVIDQLNIDKNTLENQVKHWQEEHSKCKIKLEQGQSNFIKKIGDWIKEKFEKLLENILKED